MLQLIEEDKEYNCEYEMDTWEEGAEEVDDIEEMYDSFYAFAKYEEELRKKNEKKDEEPGSQIIPYFENSALPNLDESDE